MSNIYPPWPLYQSGWTTDPNGGLVFSKEADFHVAVSKAILETKKEANVSEDAYTVDRYECRASFLPQPLESGECPSATLPWEDGYYKTWDKMQSFIEKVKDWPYIDIVADITRHQHDHNSRIQSSFPVHIFHRRLKKIN